jgi:hypothetical protein
MEGSMTRREHSDQQKPPDSPVADWAITAGEAFVAGGVSFIPIPGVGGVISAATIILAKALKGRYQKREREYVEAITASVEILQSRVAGVEERIAGDAFLTAYLQAGHVYMRTHQREKLQALRNAVLNVAAGTAPDENLQFVFLNYLDTLTPLHLTLLDCVADPREWAAQRNLPLAQGWNPDAGAIFEVVYRGQLPAENYHVQLLQDLYTRGLAGNDANPNAFLSPPPEALLPHITDLGRQFLAFITSPIPELDNADKPTS